MDGVVVAAATASAQYFVVDDLPLKRVDNAGWHMAPASGAYLPNSPDSEAADLADAFIPLPAGVLV